MNRIMSIAALVISVAALALAAHAHLNAERMAEQALHRREQKVIERMWPTMQVIYEDLLEGSKVYTGDKPDTIEKLFSPLFSVVEAMGT